MKRLFPLILCIMLLSTTACSGTAATTTTAALPKPESKSTTTTTAAAIDEPPIQENPDAVTLTMAAANIYINDDAYPLWGEDEISRRIMDMTGVKLNITHGREVLSGKSMLDVFTASEEMPDLLYTEDRSDLHKLASSEFSQALDTLALEYESDFWNQLDALEILTHQNSDGHVYAFPVFFVTGDVYDDPNLAVKFPRSIHLSTDILSQLQTEMPASVEELDQLLYTAKEQAQTLGLSLILRQYSPTASPVAEWMGVKRFLQWDAEKQKIVTPLRDDAWLPYLQLASRWYRDGILDLPDTEICWRWMFSDTVVWEYGAPITPAEYYLATAGQNSFASAGDLMAEQNLFTFRTEGTSTESFPYALFETPLTYQGELLYQAADQSINAYRHDQFAASTGALFITNSCTDVEAAIHLFAFLKGEEGAQLVRWGVQDTHYTRTAEGYVEYTADYMLENHYTDTLSKPYTKLGIGYWNWMTHGKTEALTNASPTFYFTNADHLALREMQIRAGLNYKKYAAENKNPVFGLAEPEPGTDSYTQYIQLQDYWHHAVWELVTTAADSVAVAEGWEAIKSELVTRGIEDVEQAMTVRFTDALPRFQQAGYYTDIIIR